MGGGAYEVGFYGKRTRAALCWTQFGPAPPKLSWSEEFTASW